MSPTRKANQRKRMRAVDSVIDAIRQSGVQCKALVSASHHDHIIAKPTHVPSMHAGPCTFAPHGSSNATKRQVHDLQPDIGGIQKIGSQGAKVYQGPSISLRDRRLFMLTLFANPYSSHCARILPVSRQLDFVDPRSFSLRLCRPTVAVDRLLGYSNAGLGRGVISRHIISGRSICCIFYLCCIRNSACDSLHLAMTTFSS